MSDTYLKVILISAVGGLYLIAYSLFYLGTQVYSGGTIQTYQVLQSEKIDPDKNRDFSHLLPR